MEIERPADRPVRRASPAAAPIVDAIDAVLGDHVQYETVINELQRAVAAQDAAAVAGLVSYPFTAILDGKKSVISDSRSFAAEYARIVTPDIAAAIANTAYGDLMVNDKGVMFGRGEAWISGVCTDRSCKDPSVKVIALQHAP